MFFQISGTQQIMIGLAALYLFVAFPTIQGFHKEIMWNKLYNTAQELLKRCIYSSHARWYERIRLVLVWLIIVPLEIVLVPALYFILRKHRRVKKEKDEQALADRKATEAWQNMQILIKRNRLIVDAWCQENSGKLKLYVNTMNGITAVLLPDQYSRIKRDVRQAVTPTYWPAEVYVFADRRGNTQIERLQRLRGLPVITYPSVSALRDFVNEYRIELITDHKICVPAAGPSAWADLSEIRSLGSWEEAFVEAQMPRELRPQWD